MNDNRLKKLLKLKLNRQEIQLKISLSVFNHFKNHPIGISLIYNFQNPNLA